jgi:hypothetical protein
MHEPFYVRPADHRYCLRSNPAYGWATGHSEDGSQVLRCGLHCLVFAQDGTLLRAGEADLPLREGPIEVKRFWVPDRCMGVEDLPEVLAEFYTAPEVYEMEPGDPEAWLRAGQFIFYPGWSDYIIGPGGRVEAS